jgi:hypothetical protein
VINNYFRASGSSGVTGPSISFNSTRSSIVANNFVENQLYEEGISYYQFCDEATITGNTIIMFRDPVGHGNAGILLYDHMKNFTITGNTITRANGHGIHVLGPYTRNIIISGNTCNGCLANGIFVMNYSTNIVIKGNIVCENGWYGLQTTNCADVHLTDNYGAGNVLGLIQDGSFVSNQRIVRMMSRVPVYFTNFTAAAASEGVNVFFLRGRSRLVSCILDTTTNYSGLVGTISAAVGFAAGDSSLLLSHDIKSAPIIVGMNEADVGALLSRTNNVQGGTIPSWSPGSAQAITITLTSGTGNLGTGVTSSMTNGYSTLYIAYDILDSNL